MNDKIRYIKEVNKRDKNEVYFYRVFADNTYEAWNVPTNTWFHGGSPFDWEDEKHWAIEEIKESEMFLEMV